MVEDTRALQKVGEKFIGQIAGILRGDVDLNRLADRSQKAWAILSPNCGASPSASSSFTKAEGRKQVKTFGKS